MAGAEDSELFSVDERAAPLGAVAHAKSRFAYLYDFGDDWEHDIVVERVDSDGDASIRCIGGARACPPEDCGGPPGYAHMLKVLGNPEDEERGLPSASLRPTAHLSTTPPWATPIVRCTYVGDDGERLSQGEPHSSTFQTRVTKPAERGNHALSSRDHPSSTTCATFFSFPSRSKMRSIDGRESLERSGEAEYGKQFDRWLEPFLDAFRHKVRREWAPVYLYADCWPPGDRKSVEPLAARVAPDTTSSSCTIFIATSKWETRPIEDVLASKADALVGGEDAHLIIDDTGVPKKGEHSVRGCASVPAARVGQAGQLPSARLGNACA